MRSFFLAALSVAAILGTSPVKAIAAAGEVWVPAVSGKAVFSPYYYTHPQYGEFYYAPYNGHYVVGSTKAIGNLSPWWTHEGVYWYAMDKDPAVHLFSHPYEMWEELIIPPHPLDKPLADAVRTPYTQTSPDQIKTIK